MKYKCGVEGYCTASEQPNGKFKGIFMELHPTPSGHPRHILRFSTNTEYETAGEASLALETILNKTEAQKNG